MQKIYEILFYIFFPIYKNVNWILQNKEKFQKREYERYQNLSEEKKNKKRQYARERYRNFSKEEKNKKREYCGKRYENLSGDSKQKLVTKAIEENLFSLLRHS